jgi:3-oxoacyl-[acyl-carrier protein] reductase
MTGVQGRRALVTGAGSADGIGFATARILAERGARVAITSTTKRIFDRLAGMPQRVPHAGGAHAGAGHVAFATDLTAPGAADRLVADATRALGGIDILVNNAGMVQTGHRQQASRLHRIDDAEWARAIELNLNIAFRVTRAALPQMMRRRYGRIVHISSVTGPLVSNPRSAGYSAGKAAMTGMMRALALEVAAKGITVNSVGPGWIATSSSTKRETVAGKHTPIGRSASPAEIGHVAAFLAAEEASYLTGQLIVVDGGNSIQENKGPEKGYY